MQIRRFLLLPLLLLLLVPGCRRSAREEILPGPEGSWRVRHPLPEVEAGDEKIGLELQARKAEGFRARVVWRRQEEKAEQARRLPLAPALGGEFPTLKVELPSSLDGSSLLYYFEGTLPGGGSFRLPETGELAVTCKGGVSKPLLVAHVVTMFLGLLLLLLAFRRCQTFLRRGTKLQGAVRSVLWATLFMFIGGVPLGMAVEKQVFNTWWEGWPFGRDVTDTKTGLILLVWILLCLRRPHLGTSSEGRARRWCWWVLGSTLFTILLYLIPHANLKF